MPVIVGEGGEEGYREDREQLLALNQVLARQVMERSRNIIGNISLLFKSVQYPNVQTTKRPNDQMSKQTIFQTTNSSNESAQTTNRPNDQTKQKWR